MKEKKGTPDIIRISHDVEGTSVKTKTEYEKKESFVKYLLGQYGVERNEYNENDNHAYASYDTLRSDIDLLAKTIFSVEKKRDEEVEIQKEEFQEFTKSAQTLLSELEKKIARLTERIEHEDDDADSSLKAKARAPRIKEDVLRLYEKENVQLKRINIKLMRLAHEAKYSSNTSAVSSDQKRGSLKDVSYLMDEIKMLENKKIELIRDNIQINELSQELMSENTYLKKQIEKLQQNSHLHGTGK